MKRKKLLAPLAVAAAGILALVLDISCPIRALTGVPCPACGLTRATEAFLKGDAATAFYYHPLFPLAWAVFGLIALYFALNAKKKLTPKGELVFLLLFAGCGAAFLAVYLFRLACGSIP